MWESIAATDNKNSQSVSSPSLIWTDHLPGEPYLQMKLSTVSRLRWIRHYLNCLSSGGAISRENRFYHSSHAISRREWGSSSNTRLEKLTLVRVSKLYASARQVLTSLRQLSLECYWAGIRERRQQWAVCSDACWARATLTVVMKVSFVACNE